MGNETNLIQLTLFYYYSTYSKPPLNTIKNIDYSMNYDRKFKIYYLSSQDTNSNQHMKYRGNYYYFGFL